MNSRNPPAAFGVAVLGIAIFAMMDAEMKQLSIALGAYNALLWRSFIGVLIGGVFYAFGRMPWPSRPVLLLHIQRGVAGGGSVLLFFWGLARVPLAQGVALSFVAPLLALYLAAVLLKEKVGQRTVLASLLAFAGVVVILAGQARMELGPEALKGSVAILVAASLYAYNIILLKRQALVAKPAEVAFFLNLVAGVMLALAAPWFAILPGAEHWPGLTAAAVAAFVSLMLLAWAYARAEAQYLLPVEYTAFVWAALLGWWVFGETVSAPTIGGALMIVAGCLIAARRKGAPDGVAEPA